MLKISFFLIIFLTCAGCTKHSDPVNVAANVAHQQIIAIRESLPPECQTKSIDEQLKAHDAAIDAIVGSCDLQKEKITAEKLRWQWAFIALCLILGILTIKKVSKYV